MKEVDGRNKRYKTFLYPMISGRYDSFIFYVIAEHIVIKRLELQWIVGLNQ